MTIDWVSGLYEGEGTLVKDKRRQASWTLRVCMTDLDVLERFKEFVGYGTISEDNSPSRLSNSRRKVSWTYIVTKRSIIKKLLTQMLPYLGNRRAHRALDCLDDFDNLLN